MFHDDERGGARCDVCECYDDPECMYRDGDTWYCDTCAEEIYLRRYEHSEP